MRSRDLFTASKNMFVNSRDLLVIFDPTNGINTNNHLLLPINSPYGEEVGGSWPLAYLLTWLALSSLSHLLSVRGKNPNKGVTKILNRHNFRKV